MTYNGDVRRTELGRWSVAATLGLLAIAYVWRRLGERFPSRKIGFAILVLR